MADFSIESMMADLNRNLATSRRSLSDFIDSGYHTFKVRDGSVIEIPEEQLELLWSVCSDPERLGLKLPIYISTDTSCDCGAWKVDGKYESAVVAKLLEKTIVKEGTLRLYHPDLKTLKTKIPDAILMIFAP